MDELPEQELVRALVRIDALEADVKRWQQQSNAHYLYTCQLDKLVASQAERIAELTYVAESLRRFGQ